MKSMLTQCHSNILKFGEKSEEKLEQEVPERAEGRGEVMHVSTTPAACLSLENVFAGMQWNHLLVWLIFARGHWENDGEITWGGMGSIKIIGIGSVIAQDPHGCDALID